MLLTVLAFLAALQSQTPAPNVQVASLTPAPTPASAPAPEAPEAAEAPAEAAAPEPEVEAEPEVAEPRTREVCRYVEAPGRRFPIRRCRTIEVDD